MGLAHDKNAQAENKTEGYLSDICQFLRNELI